MPYADAFRHLWEAKPNVRNHIPDTLPALDPLPISDSKTSDAVHASEDLRRANKITAGRQIIAQFCVVGWHYDGKASERKKADVKCELLSIGLILL